MKGELLITILTKLIYRKFDIWFLSVQYSISEQCTLHYVPDSTSTALVLPDQSFKSNPNPNKTVLLKGLFTD